MTKKIRLGDIATLITKGTTPTTMGFSFVNVGINFVKIESISENGVFLLDKFAHITNECNDKLKRSQLQENDILFSIAGAIGRSTIVPRSILPANVNQALAIIRIPQNAINLHFVLYALQSQTVEEQSEKQKQGVAQLNLSLKNIGDILIPLVSYKEQDEIVKNLTTIDTIITLRKEQKHLIDQLVKSRFIEMFGDCVVNPKGWKTKCLEDIAEVGSSKRVFIEELQESGIPFYRGTEVGALAEGKQISPELFITEEHYTELCKAIGAPQIGDLLMPSICPDGRIWVVNTEKPFYFKDGRVLWVHAIDNSYNPVFLLYTLKDRIMADYSSIASGTTFAELKIFALKKCRIFDVPIALQNEFAAFVAQTDKSKLAIQKSLEKLEILKKSLMQKYFG